MSGNSSSVPGANTFLYLLHLFGKAKKWFNQGRDGRPHGTVADWNALKEQFKQQFNPVGNTKEKKMLHWRNIKWDGNETLDEFSYSHPTR